VAGERLRFIRLARWKIDRLDIDARRLRNNQFRANERRVKRLMRVDVQAGEDTKMQIDFLGLPDSQLQLLRVGVLYGLAGRVTAWAYLPGQALLGDSDERHG
jgi:hypothetical protein